MPGHPFAELDPIARRRLLDEARSQPPGLLVALSETWCRTDRSPSQRAQALLWTESLVHRNPDHEVFRYYHARNLLDCAQHPEGLDHLSGYVRTAATTSLEILLSLLESELGQDAEVRAACALALDLNNLDERARALARSLDGAELQRAGASFALESRERLAELARTR